MAYDSARNVTVLFGGFLPGDNGETWEYDGTTAQWSLRASTGPSPRRMHAMAYDATRCETVLFGGLQGASTYIGDTWVWNGTTWAQVAMGTSPLPRGLHALAFDSDRSAVVLFGGWTPAQALGDTWEWNGANWSQRSASGPAPGGLNGLTYDPFRLRTILFQGDRTWTWDGTNWTLAVGLGPQLRSAEAMCFDVVRQCAVLHGGVDDTSPALLQDTWGLRLTTATATAYGAACGAPAPTLSAHPGSRPILGQTHLSDIDHTFLGFAAMTLGFASQALPLDFLGINGCVLLNTGEELTAFCAATSTTTSRHSLAIPPSTSLLTHHVYLQAWTLAPGFNPLGIALSNGLDLVIGDA